MRQGAWGFVVAAALCVSCGDDDDDAARAVHADAGCEIRDDQWSTEYAFRIEEPDSDVTALPECVPTCTRNAPRHVDDFPSVAALPAGSCVRSAAVCQMSAYVPCRCYPNLGAVSQYRCQCDGDEWSCVNVSPGGAVCRNDCERDASHPSR